MSEKTHKLAAIVFTDIVGYTKRMEEDEQKTMQLLQTQRDIVFPIVASYGGEVVKEIGDGLMMMFDSAVQAVRFAISVQTRLKDEELTIRAGIHIGDVIFSDGDVFGSAVNTAARIEPLASPNGICISEDVRSQLHNKADIITVSMGKKELKGVKEQIEIYEIFIEGVSEKKVKSVGFFFKDLWNRRVLQILLGYIAASWIIKQAVAAMIGKYMLSPYLTELAWIVLLSLIPTVFLLAYFHGNRSSGKWNRIEIFGMPANVLFTIILVVILFNDKDLGAATTNVTYENEEGEMVTRTVLKNEYRKKLAIFFFENKSGDPSLDWLQYGLNTIIEFDISQDMSVEISSAAAFISKLKDAGYNDGLGTPLMLKRKIATYYHKDFFTEGSFDFKDNVWSVELKIYDINKGQLLQTITSENPNIFELSDKVTIELKKAMKIPEARITSTEDLAVSEIFTGSFEAFKYFTKSQVEIFLHNNFEKSLQFAEKAVEEDNDFVIARIKLAENYFNTNQPEKARQSLEIIRDKLFILPERKQFAAKFFYYIVNQQAAQAMAVLKMWAELYPTDIDAHMMLAERYLVANEPKSAINEYKTILKIVPEEYQHIQTLGDLYERIGRYDSSLYYYEQYAKKYPTEYISYKNIGDTYLKLSDFDKARDNYEKALLIDPENANAISRIFAIHLKQGETQEALDLLNSAYRNAKTPMDSLTIVDGFESYYEYTGEMETSFNYFLQKVPLWEKIVPPLRVMVFRTFFISKYVKAHRSEEALEILNNIKAELQPPFDKIAAFGYLFYYTEIEEAEKAESYIDEAHEIIEEFGEQSLLPNIYFAQGKIAELKGDNEKATKNYLDFYKSVPDNIEAIRLLSNCYLKLKDFKNAEIYLNEALKSFPVDAKNFYLAAEYYLATGENEKALDYCKKANEIWKNADSNYEPAIKARQLLDELSNL